MLKIERKEDGTLVSTFRWRYALITVALVPDKGSYTLNHGKEEYLLNKSCAAGSYVCKHLTYLLAFRKGYKPSTVIHECWHLFFFRMDDIDGNRYLHFDEVGNEVYAYDFEELYDIVSETLNNMKKEDKKLKK